MLVKGQVLLVPFKKSINMFESMVISQSIYGKVVAPSYKKKLGNMPTMVVTQGR